jgi:hypothetical protein
LVAVTTVRWLAEVSVGTSSCIARALPRTASDPRRARRGQAKRMIR